MNDSVVVDGFFIQVECDVLMLLKMPLIWAFQWENDVHFLMSKSKDNY